MPNDQYKEVLIVVIACITLFLILAAIILAFLFMYLKRRLMQVKELASLRQQLNEESLQAQLEIQEQTFLAISQEIHDNVGQILSLAKVQVNIMDEGARLDRELLQAIRENIGKAMTDLRDLSKSLNSERIRAMAIHDSLRQEADRINRAGVLLAEVMVDGTPHELNAQKKLILFRILQESIQNCLKHAESTRLSVGLQYEAESVSVSIRDNGKGFDPAALPGTGGGQGLGNIRNRIRLTGGAYQIVSNPGEGTHITITIPYE